MADKVKSMGNCYICGAELGKTAMKNHLFKAHQKTDGGQRCYLLKIEGFYNKDYWLFVDVPVNSSLSVLDSFLREIWLECCGHLSAFYVSRYDEISPSRKWSNFSVGDKLVHEYDFGSTTETLITVMGETQRPKQVKAVRLLARNAPPQFKCALCGSPAECVDACNYDDSFLCNDCTEQNDEGCYLPITNSPRIGVCGYDGELDVFGFNPKKIS